MYPEICKIGPFTIYSYGVMLVFAFMVGAALSALRAKKENLNPDTIFNLCFVVFVSGVIGARIFYVIEHIGDYINNPLEVIMFQHGGLSWFGGLIMGLIAGFVYLKNKNLAVKEMQRLLKLIRCNKFSCNLCKKYNKGILSICKMKQKTVEEF